MQEELTYIDGVKEAHFLGGTIRLSLFYLEAGEDGPLERDAGRLVMTQGGFLSMLEAMEQLAEKLVEKGVLSRNKD